MQMEIPSLMPCPNKDSRDSVSTDASLLSVLE